MNLHSIPRKRIHTHIHYFERSSICILAITNLPEDQNSPITPTWCLSYSGIARMSHLRTWTVIILSILILDWINRTD